MSTHAKALRVSDLIDQLMEIERVGNVNDIRVGETCLWPLLRTMVWSRLSNQLILPIENPGSSRETKVQPDFFHAPIEEKAWYPPAHSNRLIKQALHFADRMRRKWRANSEQRELQLLQGTEVLFWSRHHSYGDAFGGRYYNRHMDALMEFTRKRFTCAKIEVASEEGFKSLPRWEKTVFLTPPLPDSSMKQERVTGHESLYKAALEIANIDLRNLNLQKTATTFCWRRSWFEKLLKIIRPKIVFLGGFFVSTEAALVSACRKLGIRTVECQHGRCGDLNAFFTHWSRIPEKGYDTMPDFFWAWGEATKQQVTNGRTDHFDIFRPVVGGHRWLAKWKSGIPFKLEPSIESFLEQLGACEKVILYSFQTLAEPLPDHVLKAMRSSPKGWCWLLRLHPLMLADISTLEAYLKENGVVHFEIERATTTPLFALLSKSHHHVTCSSSVAVEAATFGIPTSIVSPEGQRGFEKLIGNGLYLYAADTDVLLKQIHDSKPMGLGFGDDNYIETSDTKANEALDTILNLNDPK